MAYFGPDATLFQGSIRDNVTYSLKRPTAGTVLPHLERIGAAEDRRRYAGDAGATSAWTDYAAAGANDPRGLDNAIVSVLTDIGAAEGVFRLGLSRKLNPKKNPDLAQRLVDARTVLQRQIAEKHLEALIEPFDPERFNRNATIGENLFFGVARSDDARDQNLVSDPDILDLLERVGLRTALCDVGLRIAGTMVEIFVDVAADNFLFERFSFISAEELPTFGEIVQRAGRGGQAALSMAEHSRLISLAMAYGEPLHRLGLINADFASRIVQARTTLRQGLPARLADAIEFYDPAGYCAAAPLRDNLLFGRIDQTIAGAEERVSATLHTVVRECSLEREVFGFGLDHEGGPGGRLLAPSQRSAIALARCLIKRPRILVVEQLSSIFGDIEGKTILNHLRERMTGGTLILATRDAVLAAGFDLVLAFRGNRLHTAEAVASTTVDGPAAMPDGELPEVQALRAVPMFATIDTGRLKLIAFTSERLSFAAGQTLFRQGDPSDAAYVVLSGTVDVFLDTPSGRLHLSNLGEHAVVGEMGVVSGSGRSATVIAATDLITIRLSKDIFMGLLTEFPQIALAVMRDQIRRIITTDAKLVASPAAGRPADQPSRS
jgi:putative ABC transport system ATP-binding protein